MKNLKILLLLWSMLVSLTAFAQTAYRLQPDFIQTDGDVNAVIEHNGRLYIGGNFNYAGYSTGPGTVLSLQSGLPDIPFDRVTGGQVNVAVPDGQGGWYIGGSFERVGGIPRRAIARIKADKTVDEIWQPIADPTAVVNSICVVGETVFVGGTFTTMGSASRANLALLNNVNGLAIATFNPAPDGPVLTMQVVNGILYVGGSFNSMSGFARRNMAAFTLSTGQLANFSPSFDGAVRTFWFNPANASFFVGGDFRRCNGQKRDFIAQVDLNNNTLAWNPSGDAPVRAIVGTGEENDLRLYVGGDFTYMGGRFRNRLAEMRPNVDTFATQAWTTGTDDAVNSIVLHDGTLYIGGNFTQVTSPGGSLIRNYIAQIETISGAVSGWDPDANNNINTISIAGNRMYVGGQFSTIGRRKRSNVFSIDQTSGLITGWSPQVVGQVRALAAANNIIYLGGDFTSIGPDNRRFIAAVSTGSNNAQIWNPNANARVHALHLKNNVLYAGGEFTRIGATDRKFLAGINLSTGAATSFNPDPDGRVYALASDDSRLFVGGEFTVIGQNLEQKNLGAVFLFDGKADATWNTNTDEPVRALSVDISRERLYIGGEFKSIQNINSNTTSPIEHLAALSLVNGDLDVSWVPDPMPNSNVLSIWSSASRDFVFVGGAFTNISPSGRLVQLAVSNAENSGFNSGINDGEVRVVLGLRSDLYAGGTFDNVVDLSLGQRARSLAKYTTCGATVRLETSATELCPGQSAVITSFPTGFGEFFYRWSPSTGLSSTITKEVAAAPDQTTTYTLTVTDGENCIAVGQITITVQPPTIPDAGEEVVTCRGNDPQLTATGGARYIWTPGEFLDDSTSVTPIVRNLPRTTTFTLTAFSGPNCIGFDVVTVRLIDPPVVSLPDSQFICIGRADSLELNPTNTFSGGQYRWVPTAGLSNPNIRNPKALPSSSVTYTLSYTSQESCTAIDSVRIQLVGAISVSCGADREICNGDSTQMNLVSDATVFIWDPPFGISNTRIKNPFLFPSDTTTYIVTAIGKGCIARDTIVINVKQGPELDAGPDQVLCTGQVVQLNARGNGTGYQWLPAEGLSNTTIANPIATPSSTTTYTVSSAGPDGCRKRDFVTVFVRQAPNLTVGNQIVYACSGDSAIMSVSGAFSYSWLPLEGISRPNSTVPRAAPAQTTTYTVTGRDQFGCEATAEVVVVVAEKPVADAGPDLTVCRGNKVTLSGSGGLTYLWETTSGEVFERTAQNPEVSPLASSTYVLTVFNEEGCFSKDAVRVSVIDAPLADAGRDTFMCPGFDNFVRLQASGGFGYLWSPSESLSNPNIPNPIARPTQTTTYTVQVTGANSCVRIDSVTVRVLPAPIASAGPNVLACPGEPVLLLGSGGVTYEWSPAALLDNPFSATPRATVSRRTVFTVTVKNELGCISQDQTVVTLDTVIRVQATAVSSVLCKGNSTELNATAGAISYRWSPVRGLSNPLINTPVASPDTTTIYTVTAVGANGCTGTASIRIVVNPLPVNATAGADTFACRGGTVQLQARGGIAYTWTPADGLSNPNISNPVASPQANTTYFVTITSDNGCSIVDTIRVNVFEIPSITITPSGDPLSIACDQSGILLTTLSRPGYRYQWRKDGNAISGANAASYTAVEGGLYSVEVSSRGCSRTSDGRRVVVQPRPNAVASNDVAICSGGTGISLTASGGNQYEWTPVQGLSNPNVANPVANPERTTTYTVRVTDTATGCFDIDEVTVTVNDRVVLTVSSNGPTSICEGQSVELIATTAPGYSYQWKRNDVAIADGRTARYMATLAGNYTVELTVPGCPLQTSSSINVTVNARPEVDAGKGQMICLNGRAVLRASGAVRYQWMPSVNISNPTDAEIVARPTQTTVYTVTGFSEAGCVDIDTVTIEVLPTETLPPAVITPLTALRVCPGTAIELKANINLPGMNVGYQWYLNDRRISGAVTSTYTATEAGEYRVELLSDVCGSSLSEIKMLDYRSVPQLILSRRNVSCFDCRDGEIKAEVLGGTRPFSLSKNDEPFVANVNLFSNLPKGRYKITVRDSAGCTDSDSITIESPTSVNTLSKAFSTLEVYPNPSQGLFMLTGNLTGTATLEVYDLKGKLILVRSLTGTNAKVDTEIDLSGTGLGVYLLKISSEKGDFTVRKLIVE